MHTDPTGKLSMRNHESYTVTDTGGSFTIEFHNEKDPETGEKPRQVTCEKYAPESEEQAVEAWVVRDTKEKEEADRRAKLVEAAKAQEVLFCAADSIMIVGGLHWEKKGNQDFAKHTRAVDAWWEAVKQLAEAAENADPSVRHPPTKEAMKVLADLKETKAGMLNEQADWRVPHPTWKSNFKDEIDIKSIKEAWEAIKNSRGKDDKVGTPEIYNYAAGWDAVRCGQIDWDKFFHW